MKTYGEFFRDDTGAVTIDWVALTAGILLLGIMVVYAIFNGGVAGLVVSINDTLAGVTTDVNLGIAMGCGAVENCGGGAMALFGEDGPIVPVGSTVSVTDGDFDSLTMTITDPSGDFVWGASGMRATPVIASLDGATVSSATTFELADGSTVQLSEVFVWPG